MELLKTLYKTINFVFPFSDFFYILQLEEYSSKRLFKWLPKFFLKRNFQKRDTLKFTKRVKISLVFSIMIWGISYLCLAVLINNQFLYVLLILLWIVLIPIFVLAGNLIISPYFEYIKSKIRAQSILKVKSNPDLKIIVVAGSYGKTTTKNFIQQLVKYNYKTQMIPGNINTPAGIATWVNNNLELSTQLLIAEVDAYQIGEIAKSCEILKSDIAVLINIGDQHLERFSDASELASALSEVFTNSKENAYLITSSEVLKLIETDDFGNRTLVTTDLKTPIEYGQSTLDVTGLSTSNLINLNFALEVAKLLKISEKFVLDTVSKLELPDRRQKPSVMFGYQAIDDSYNISYTTAIAGIIKAKEESLKNNKKLLVVTAGIPELSKENVDSNKKLGEFLAENADHTVILNSILAKDVQQGFTSKLDYTICVDLNDFLKTSNEKFPTENWFLLMQPELNDLYY